MKEQEPVIKFSNHKKMVRTSLFFGVVTLLAMCILIGYITTQENKNNPTTFIFGFSSILATAITILLIILHFFIS